VVPAYNLFWKGKEYLLSAKKFNLLNEINNYDSTSEASKTVKISYRSALNYIGDIENNLNIKVVKTFKGGKGGGGSTHLTSEGKKILKKCKVINAIIELHKGLNEIETIVSNIDNNNNMMEIEFNDFKLILPIKKEFNVGDKVLALIGYDSVFVMLEPYRSSVRNILKGIITEMQLIDNMFRIRINVGNVGIYCDITRLASDDLELELGKEVYIGFKAMAVAMLKL
jgi:molybdate transport system regulatory protein